MTALAALERAVLAEPRADDPRAELARALTAGGDPRGEFIALQLEIARRRRADDVSVAAWGELAKRAEAIRLAHGAAWLPALPAYARGAAFTRGFVEHVTVELGAFVAAPDALFAVAPIRRISARGTSDDIVRLAELPALGLLVGLDLARQPVGDRGAIALAASPHVTGLVWLDLTSADIGAVGLDALLASPTLAALRYCQFDGNRVPSPEESIGVDGGVVWADPSAATLAAEARFGSRPWLRAPSLHPYAYPPEPDDLLGA